MLIDENSPAVTETSEKTWRDALINAKVLLNKIDTAIAALQGGIQEYSLDTGQDKQTVKRSSLGDLFARRKALLNEIAILEARLGIGRHKQVRRIAPGF